MVPLVGERLVDLLEEGQSSMIPAPYIGFRHSVPRPVEASAPLLSTGFPKYTHVQSGTRERARAEAFFRKHGIELDPAYLLDGGAAPSGLGGIGPLVTWGWAPQANQIAPLRGIQGPMRRPSRGALSASPRRRVGERSRNVKAPGSEASKHSTARRNSESSWQASLR